MMPSYRLVHLYIHSKLIEHECVHLGYDDYQNQVLRYGEESRGSILRTAKHSARSVHGLYESEGYHGISSQREQDGKGGDTKSSLDGIKPTCV